MLFDKAFEYADLILKQAVITIADIISTTSVINLDFADVKTVKSELGTAMMGSGVASGEDRAEEAAEGAIACPLLEDIDLSGARGILVNITAGPDFAIDEFETVGNAVKAFASENATVVVGTVIDMEMTDELRVTVVATGIGAERKPDISLVSNEGSRLTSGSRNFTQGREATVPQQSTEGNQALKTDELAQPNSDLEYLDIPAFLRRQAD